jgi:hypothetical protein
MKRSLLLHTSYSILFLLFFNSHSMTGQNVFWSEDFQNGIPTDWANYEPSSSFIKWSWTMNTTQGLISGQPNFTSSTVGNGFMLFNSGQLGNTFHDTRLTTNSIDCSAQNTVVLRFENQYGFFSNGSVPMLGVSTDSINWSYDTLFTSLISNQLSDAIQMVELDISSIAANQSNVYLQFRWKGKDEYAWRLDDIRLQDGATPPPTHNTSIQAYAIPKNYATPLSHVQPIEMAAQVFNNGLATANNLKLKVNIYNHNTNTILYSDSIGAPALNVNDNTVLEISSQYTPTTTGTFRLEYQLMQDSTDGAPADNLSTNVFIVTDSLFSKDNNTGFGSAKPSSASDYMIGNIYEVKTADHFADKVIFNCGHPSNFPMTGLSVDVLLYEVASTVDAFFNNFNNNQVTAVGLGQYIFTSSDNSFDFFVADIKDINGDKVKLKANHRYFMMLSFSGPAKILDIGVSDALSYDTDYATIIRVGNTWYLDGFGPSLTAIVRMTTTEYTSTENVSSLENQVTIYPNPANGYINVNLDLENEKSVIINAITTTGKLIFTKKTDQIKNSNTILNISSWSSGIYFIQIQGKNSQITRRIVVE